MLRLGDCELYFLTYLLQLFATSLSLLSELWTCRHTSSLHGQPECSQGRDPPDSNAPPCRPGPTAGQPTPAPRPVPLLLGSLLPLKALEVQVKNEFCPILCYLRSFLPLSFLMIRWFITQTMSCSKLLSCCCRWYLRKKRMHGCKGK